MMFEPYATAFEAAKEITIAKLESSDVAAFDDSGENAADFFEAVYKRLVKIAEEASKED